MPIDDNAFFAMLGIAMRAGVLTLGEEGVLKAISSGKAAFVLLDEEASANTKKMFANSCEHYGVRLIALQGGRLGQAIGKPGRRSAAVVRGTLADKLLAMAGQETR